jgi:beta-lactamase superfamily II metal-dependent hydrolase
VFTIEMLPAERGDTLWLTYGSSRDLHHVLIDGGPKETIETMVPTLEDRIERLGTGANRIELLTITHVDADHIQGIVSLLSDHSRVKLFRDVWFNGHKHLGLLGGPDGERLTTALEANPGRWNRAFGGGPVAIPSTGALPTRRLRGGLEITLLSPTPEDLARLAPKWERECKKAGIVTGKGAAVPRSWRRDRLLGLNFEVLAAKRYYRDRAEANGSSIAFIAAYEGRSVLCAGDAHSEVLERSLDRLGSGPHTFAAVKVSHHGSRANLSPTFVERVRSRNWLFSTNASPCSISTTLPLTSPT